jgi:hypothetical protein
VRESHIIDVARQVIKDEEILGAGVLQPTGAMEGMSGGLIGNTIGDAAGVGALGAASGMGGLAAGRVAAAAQGVPRWTLVAVTPTRVVLLSVHSTYLLSVRNPEPFAEIDRARVRVTREGFAGAAWYVLKDTRSGREYHLECSRGLSLGNGNDVMKLIAGGEVPTADSTTTETDADR